MKIDNLYKSDQPIIQTERLLLRPVQHSDAKNIQLLAGNKNVSETTLNIPYPYEDGMAENWIPSCKNNWVNRTESTFAITGKNTQLFFGISSLVAIRNAQAELGYWIGEPYWNKGYCTEAAKALVEFGFCTLELKKIIAQHFTNNPASGKVMKKIGMNHAGGKLIPDRNGCVAPVEIYQVFSSK